MLHATCTLLWPPSVHLSRRSFLYLSFSLLHGSSQLDSGQALIFMRMLRVLYARRRCRHVNDNTIAYKHTHTHTETHPPAHAHLHRRVRLGRRRRAEHTVLHSELDGIKQAGPTSLSLSPLAVTEPVHCADLQRNEICFIMQNANTPDMHSYTVSAHYTYATCAVPQKMSSADDCENTAACMAQVMS